MTRPDKHVLLSALTVVLLACAICFRFYGEILMEPGQYLFGPSGDGMKNYFSVAFQVVHGDGLWFEGMLYPYGDHLIYADGQPLLTKVLQGFVEPDVNNGTTVIAIMNLLMIGSLVVTAWCVHRLLIWNLVNAWFAVPFSLAIAFLSPQVARFAGHYALAYTFFIPLCWLLIAAFHRYRWPWATAVLAGLIMLAFGFLHPYYLFIFVIFLGSVMGWELLLKRFRSSEVELLLPRLFTLVVPLVLFMVYQHFSDPYTDRPSDPAGMFSHLSSFQSIFTPTANPFRDLFHSYFFRVFMPTSWEGNAYVGMVPALVLFGSIVPFLKKLGRKQLRAITHPALPRPLRDAFFPAILTLLFAMGVFHHLGLAFLAEFISPIKQFRSLGRVAWIFYYVVSIWTVHRLYLFFRYAKAHDNGRYAYHFTVICAVAAFAWMLDAVVNIKYTKESMLNPTASAYFGPTTAQNWRDAGVQIDDHQAILPLPMMLIGSEKIGIEKGWLSSKHAMIAGFSTGKPMIGGAMSRTSLEVSVKTAQLRADSLFPRLILTDLDEQKNILLLRSEEPLNLEEQRLIDLSQKVYECAEYQLYSLSVDDVRHEYARIAEQARSLEATGTAHYFTPTRAETKEETLWGASCYRVVPGSNLLDTVFDTSARVNLSYWVKLDPREELTPNRVYSIDREWKMAGGIGSSANVMCNWLLVSDELQTEAGKRHVVQIDARPGTISRIMLRKADERIIHMESNGTRYINNVPVGAGCSPDQ